MHSEERKVYFALLIAGSIFFVVIITFLITIISYQRKSVAVYLKRVKADLTLSEQNRLRWAADIHDDFGSKISAIKLLLEDFTPADSTGRILTDKVTDSINNMMHSVRQISNNMVPYALQREGLVISLKELLESLFADSSYTVVEKWDIHETDINEDNQIHIYRIAQELLSNIIKHANANHIDISLQRVKGNIRLCVSDNGIGFHKAKVQKLSQGLGLRNITARVNLMKGSVYLITNPGKGTSYEIVLPAH